MTIYYTPQLTFVGYKFGNKLDVEAISQLDQETVIKAMKKSGIRVKPDNFDSVFAGLDKNSIERLGKILSFEDYKSAVQKFNSEVLSRFLDDFYQ